ncbi:MAG: hypothetical protein AAFV88_24365 [Planctomycetota bacterium]
MVAILGALTAVAALSVRQPLKRAELELFVEQLKAMDANAREHASRGETLSLELDLLESSFALVNDVRKTRVSEISIPPSVQIGTLEGFKKIRSRDQAWSVRLSEFGTSSTYGFSLGLADRTQRWIVFLGLTGQPYSFESRDPFDSILRVQ